MLKIFKYKKNQLLPLKCFAEKSLYQINYLSVLVQRKKLKAKKIGRVYYTTEKWFIEYLAKHAQAKILNGYAELFANRRKQISDPELNRSKNQAARKTGGFFVGLKSGWYRPATLVLGILILVTLIANLIVTIDSQRGTVSGVDEENFDVASTTMELIDYEK